MSSEPSVGERLAEPFDPADVKWKPQQIKGNRALALCFIDARLIQDRLDEVVGVENWQDKYNVLPDGSVVCELSINFASPVDIPRWIVKTDVGSLSEQPDAGDRLKAAFSDALKRAAVKFGIGRYLYRLKPDWVDYDPAKKQLAQVPGMPEWALPFSHRPCGERTAEQVLGLIRTVAEATKTPAVQVAASTLETHKYPRDTPLTRVRNRDAAAIMLTLNKVIQTQAAKAPAKALAT